MPLDDSLQSKIFSLAGLESKELKTLFDHCSVDLPSDVVKRLRPYILLESKQMEIDQCNLSASFQELQFVDNKVSASQSWILFAKFLGEPVAIKVATEPYRMNILSHFLSIERRIYRELINPIVICGFSPHVLIYYGSISCDRFFYSIENNAQVLQFKQQLSLKAGSFKINEIRASVIERAAGGMTLSEFLQTADNSIIYNKELFAILFQIFYTLKVFSQIGLSHNDLHSGNIFLMPATTRQKYYQITAQDYRQVSSTFDVFIFDFDRGSKIATVFEPTEIENYGLSNGGVCAQFGQCNGVNERAEIFPLLASVHAYTKNVSSVIDKLLTDIIPQDIIERPYHNEALIDNTLVEYTLAFPGRLCTCNNMHCTSCSVLNDPRIKVLDEILALDQFNSDEFLASKETIPMDAFIWRLPFVSAETKWKELHASANAN